MKSINKLSNPLFVTSVAVLVLNDLVLKSAYPGWFTGKLSDFAGLFAFPFFLAALFSKRAKMFYVFTLLFFVFWKTPFAQPLIDYLNHIGWPAYRAVDYTDYIALFILPASWYVYKKPVVYSLQPVLLMGVVIFSVFAFVATERPPGKETRFYPGKTYTFDFPKRELVSRWNRLQLEYVNDVNNSGNGKAHLDSASNIYYYGFKNGVKGKDTLAMIVDYQKLKDQDTILLPVIHAKMTFSGNETTSALKLVSINSYIRNAHKMKDSANYLDFFENGIVKKLKNGK